MTAITLSLVVHVVHEWVKSGYWYSPLPRVAVGLLEPRQLKKKTDLEKAARYIFLLFYDLDLKIHFK